MRIGILGTRGIPNHYGGFEQFAEIVSEHWSAAGHKVSVYCSHNHPYGNGDLGRVERILIYDPESQIGTTGQFVYDALCILDARKRNFDVLLQLGYTSSAIWYWLLPRKPYLFTNMDGLEWKRTKFSAPVQKAIHWFEGLAVRHGGHLISDSIGIQAYLKSAYGAQSQFIAYGADPVPDHLDSKEIEAMGLEPGNYNLLIARMEPENHIEMILEGIRLSGSKRKTIIVGGLKTSSALKWQSTFTEDYFQFTGGIYDKNLLDKLRQHCYVYYHGHSVGGTNPSLLEAMAAGAPICAHHNPYNFAVLENDGLYFNSSSEVAHFQSPITLEHRSEMVQSLRNKVRELYNWERISLNYLSYFHSVAKDGRA